MNADKIEKLEAAGFGVGDAVDFLELRKEEVAQVDALRDKV